MADVTVESAVAGVATSRGWRKLVFVSESVGYFFYVDSGASTQHFNYVKTSDGGATWGGAVTVKSDTVGAMTAFDVWFDKWTPGDSGTLIHMWYFGSGDDDVQYRTLDTSSDTLGTERTIYAGTSVASGVGAFITGAKMRGGNLYCAFDIDAGAEHGTYRSTDGGVNWGSRTDLVEATTDWALLFPGNEADNQDAWVLYFDQSASALTLKTIDDSANTDSESSTILSVTASGTDGTGQHPFAGAIRLSDGHLIMAVWSERDSATGDFRVWDINGSGSMVEKTAIATDKDDSYYPSVFIDQNNDDIYVSYVGKIDGSETLNTTATVCYSRSINGGTSWETEVVYSATADDWRNTATTMGGKSTRFYVAWRDISAASILGNQDNSIALPRFIRPSTAAMAIATFAPTALIATTVTPATASLAVATFAPTLHGRVTPPPAALTVAGNAPTLLIIGPFNGVIEVQLSNLSADSDEECGVCFRKTDSSNFLTAYVDDGDNLVHLSKFEAGAETSIATAAWTAADTAELRVICQGSRIRVWVDRKLVIDATDSTFQDQVNAGLFSRSTTAVLFGAFYAQSL